MVGDALPRETGLLRESLSDTAARNYVYEGLNSRGGLELCDLFVVQALDELTGNACFSSQGTYRSLVRGSVFAVRSLGLRHW